MSHFRDIVETGFLLIDGKDIAYTVHRRIRRRLTLAFYLESANKIRLHVPMCFSRESVKLVLEERREWIARRLSELSPPAPLSNVSDFSDGAVFFYLGVPHVLRIMDNPIVRQGCHAADGFLNVNVPVSSNTDVIEDARLEILLWYKKKANVVLRERTDYWSKKLDLKYRSVKIVSPLRQWGSCTFSNDIRYNWRIIMATVDLIDYLVVHELCHIAHKNHSECFWTLLASAIPDWRERRKQLKYLNPALVFG